MSEAKEKSDRHFWMVVQPYPSHRKRYYRLMWGYGRRVYGCCHINGGNVNNPVAQRRKLAVEEAIAQGKELDEVIRIVAGFKRARPGPKPF